MDYSGSTNYYGTPTGVGGVEQEGSWGVAAGVLLRGVAESVGVLPGVG